MVIVVEGFGQVLNCVWAKNANGLADDLGYYVATDINNNVYIVGCFMSSSIIFGSYTFTNNGSYDLFLVKYDAFGNVLWATSAGGGGIDRALSVATDSIGNVFVTGYTQSGSITFGSNTLTNINMFVVKFDGTGNALWARGDDLGGIGQSVTTDDEGNVYVTGYFMGSTITFGSTTLFNIGGNYTIFTVKYDGLGNALWAKSAGGIMPDYANSIVTDNNENVYITGGFRDTSIVFGTDTLINAGLYNDVFITKYDSGGNVIWAKRAGGLSDDTGYSLIIDSIGNIYLVGTFNNTIAFDSTILNSHGGTDIFIAKYNCAGNVIWAKSAGGNNYEFDPKIDKDNLGNIYITGTFSSSSIVFGSFTLINAGLDNTFFVKYDSIGNVLWAKSFGGSSVDWGRGIATDAIGNVYLTGSFGSTSISFDSFNISNTCPWCNPKTLDIFIAKFGTISYIEEPNNGKVFTLFPNPTTSTLTIQTPATSTIEIHNLQGQIIRTIKTEGKETAIDVASLVSGVYMIKAIMENRVAVKKFVKQ